MKNYISFNTNSMFLFTVFVLYFNEVIILNEKFLLLLIFIGFFIVVRNSTKTAIEEYFSSLQRELTNEVFLFEYSIDAKYSFIYYYLNLDLLRKRVFSSLLKLYLKGLNFLVLFYYNYSFKKENLNLIQNFSSLVNEIYSFILKKYFFIKLSFLYRSYYYIFYKFVVL